MNFLKRRMRLLKLMQFAIVKIDAIFSVKKLKEKYGDVKNIGGGN